MIELVPSGYLSLHILEQSFFEPLKVEVGFLTLLLKTCYLNFSQSHYFLYPNSIIELKINEMVAAGESLTAEGLNELYGELNKLYFGDGIVLDDEIKLEWARIPHFYYDYYVYQYATGYSAAIALSQRILKYGEPAVKDYIGFLKGGCSTDPISLLKGAGVDMATTQPINEALAMFGELVKEMEEAMS